MWTLSVFRSRLFTPMMRAPAARARSRFGGGVNFDERLHVQFAAEGDEVAEKRVVERGDDQEEAVGIVGARFPDLPGIENKILAEDGQRDFFAGFAKIFERAAKEFAFGEDGESGGAGGFERLSEGGSIEWIANHAARRRSGLEFGDDVEGIAGESASEIANGSGGFYAVLKRGFGKDAFAVIDLGAAGSENAVKDSPGVEVERSCILRRIAEWSRESGVRN